jgi:hypothetical protein
VIARVLRAGMRRGRSIPGIGALVRAIDRRWWERSILASGLADAQFYAAQLGRPSMSTSRAVRHYARAGWRRGLSLNPLFDELIAGRGLPEADRVPAMYAYVIGGNKAEISVHPFWDARAYAKVSPEAAAHPQGPIGHLWERREHATLVLRAGAFEASQSVLAYVARMSALARGPESTAEPVAVRAAERADAASVIGIVQGEASAYDRRLHALADLAAEGIQVVVAAVDLPAGQWLGTRLFADLVPLAEAVLFGAAATYADVVNAAMTRVTGSRALVVDPRVALSAAEAQRCLDEARHGCAAMPLSVRFDGTVDGVGALLCGADTPHRILRDHPLEDALRVEAARHAVPALTARTFAVAVDDFRRAGGLDSGLVNELELEALSAQLRGIDRDFEFVVLMAVQAWQLEPERAFARRDPERSERRFAAAAAAAPSSFALPSDAAEVDRLFRAFGFGITGWDGHGGTRRPTLRRVADGRVRERWAIKICAPAGHAGRVWGDTHFATGLANALRRRDLEVVVDCFDARARATSYLDDVTVVVRGPYRIDPPATGVRVLWIISHPDEITRDELAQFDYVFAASERWAAKASAQFGIAVEPLLECTDTDLFFPRELPRGDDIVFVGTARGIARPAVVGPLRAGIPVKVYGPDWRGFIPADAIVATAIPNERLSERYETASIVLNDQWPAMREEGFMAMRLFDAVAAGGRVISERVDGVPELFGGAAIAFDDAEHLVTLLRQDPAEIFPPAHALAAASARVRAEHSFDARAREIVRVITAG